MNTSIYSVITGSGSYIPSREIKNDYFLNNEFFETNGVRSIKQDMKLQISFWKLQLLPKDDTLRMT